MPDPGIVLLHFIDADFRDKLDTAFDAFVVNGTVRIEMLFTGVLTCTRACLLTGIGMVSHAFSLYPYRDL